LIREYRARVVEPDLAVRQHADRFGVTVEREQRLTAHGGRFAHHRHGQRLAQAVQQIERLLWARGDQASSNLRLSIEELREDLLPDAQEGALGGGDPDLVATAMVGMGLMVARRMLARGKLDPEEAATFCTNFALRGARDRTGATRRRSA